MTPEQRALRARIGAHASWANTSDRTARTSTARRTFLERFEQQVDPAGELPEQERLQRATSARKAYFAQLAARSADARKKRKSS
ncbi:hypothetical protein SAMN04487819_116104 [Actinopolyspora alba]|uniref:Uncharacterized protein n=1 Tax=Actinopolyspora alba TaxID=673379 RepID=A0A1I2BHW7_9ACTN|nr:hypothetical protein [Actinopolyspora alba]SFE55527.1 hypothetical protein SAMN04487819_116104 [Actinopolyspora alba]